MGGYHNYYYDFDSETKLENWEIVRQEARQMTLQCRISEPAGNYIFLAPCFMDQERFLPHLIRFSVNGKSLPLRKKEAVYVHSSFARYGIEFNLESGCGLLTAEISLPESGIYNPEQLFFSLRPAEQPPKAVPVSRKIHPVPAEKYRRNRDDFDSAGWRKGIGHKAAPGRFGFSKGDGLLDCAMPSLGMVDKMFLCGQEKYRKPYRWSYSLLPEGMPLHGSFAPNDIGIENDDIQVNPLSVRWSAKYEGKKFTCTYSLASPGILTESETDSMRLSGLRYAGNYQSILIPRAEGIEENSLDHADIRSMSENWILIFNSTEFPDVPLMLVFDRNPQNMTVRRDAAGRLSTIEFGGCSLMLSCTPFGIERFEPGTLQVEDAIRRCRFWSRALLAYPVRCRDFFRLDEEKEIVTIRQKFEYRYIADAWNTEPLELAPLPPPLSICGTSECPDAADFRFPTKYGWLRGRFGCWSEYALPFMPAERKFPLRDEHSDIPELLREGMEQYQKLVSQFGPEKVSYPYAGAILEPFAFASTMSFFMNEKDRDFLREHLTEALPAALDDNAQSDYTVINWGEMMRKQPDHDEVIRIYQDPERKHMRLHNWYDRVEPFTGAAFKICYLNVTFFSSGTIKTGSKEEILNLKIPLIENDWGVGLTFTYLCLSALNTGSFEEIRKKWNLIQQVYSFFELMHDWACMGTGYSDNAIIWVEGANYGLFPSYIRMAEAVNDSEARAFGIYNAAKQLALRLAIIRSSLVYFPTFFEAEPWYCTKNFPEEATPDRSFQNVPNLFEYRVNRSGIYNMTTEGLYPEAYTAFRKFDPKSFDEIMTRLNLAFRKGLSTPGFGWGDIQTYSGMMIDSALNEQCPPEKFRELLAEGLQKKVLMEEWRGIHIFSRALPKNYFRCQLLAWMEMRQHPLWLEHWENMRIDSASWNGKSAVIRFSPPNPGTMKLVCGVRQMPRRIELDGENLDFRKIKSGRIEIRPPHQGTLTIVFAG